MTKPLTSAEALEAGLRTEPEDRDLSRVVPIILPLEALNSAWPGPITRINQLPFSIAWAAYGEMNTFFYVTKKEAQFWERSGLDWRVLALGNLARLSEKHPASGEKLDENGIPFLKVMLHDDAFGPSRLLLPNLFSTALGADYEVAIPEQTCAIAFRKNMSSNQAADVQKMISECYEHGTEPMCSEKFEAHQFWDVAANSPPQ